MRKAYNTTLNLLRSLTHPFKYSSNANYTTMSTRRAVVHKAKDVAEVAEVPLPQLPDNYILVKTKAVALNPTDWRSLEGRPSPGAIVGCDYSGVVLEVGKAVTKPFKVGDRVAGFARGGMPPLENGAFATTIIAKGDIQIQIPDHLSFEDAATLGVGITTVGQGLYQALGFPLPPAKVTEPTSILIYGASTATGTLGIQYAKLTGLKVYATASPHNHALLKSLGADEVFDYRDPDCGAKIRAATDDKLKYVWDTVAEHGSPEICAAALSSTGGFYGCLLPVEDFPRDDVKITHTLGYTALGDPIGGWIPAKPEDWEFGVKFWKLSAELINDKKIKAHPIELREGGLEAIPQGLADLKAGKVSGKKIVFRVD